MEKQKLNEWGLPKDGSLWPHNPDGLTADVITEGGKYRAMVKGEVIPDDAQEYHAKTIGWVPTISSQLKAGVGAAGRFTLRVPVNTPFPKSVPATEESSSAQSDTPRTDKAVWTISSGLSEDAEVVSPEFAENLERELTAALSQRDEANESLQYVYDQEPNLKEEGMQEFYGCFCHWNEIIKFCADLGIDGYSESPIEMLSRLVDQRDEAREQRDEARLILREARNALYGFIHPGEEKDDYTHAITQGENTLKQITEYLK